MCSLFPEPPNLSASLPHPDIFIVTDTARIGWWCNPQTPDAPDTGNRRDPSDENPVTISC